MNLRKLSDITVLKNGTIFDPHSGDRYVGDIYIKNGKIFDLGNIEIPSEAEIIDCKNKVITHGFCDLHVHFREPGREDKESLKTGSMAALSGGFTSVCVMPNTNPAIDSPESVNFILKKAEDCPIKIYPIGAVTKSQKGKELTEMGLMYEAGVVAFSDDGFPIQDASIMRSALEYSTLVDIPVINHAEDMFLRDNGLVNEGPMSTKLGLRGNPELAESIMVHRDLELAKYTSAKLHVPHVSTKKSIQLIRSSKQLNKCVSAEVTPHHLYFTHDDLRSYDTNLKVAPPIRSETDRESLIEAIKDGTIDCIATDHAPHTIEDKETTFDCASYGMIGLESCFGVVNKVLVKKERIISIEALIELLTVKPRKIMGFETNLFKRGVSAEITVIDPDKKWQFTKQSVKSNSFNSPFLGEYLIGKIDLTISCGNVGIN